MRAHVWHYHAERKDILSITRFEAELSRRIGVLRFARSQQRIMMRAPWAEPDCIQRATLSTASAG